MISFRPRTEQNGVERRDDRDKKQNMVKIEHDEIDVSYTTYTSYATYGSYATHGY